MAVLGLLIDTGLYYNKVHHGVTVSGVDVGGLTEDEAVATLTEFVEGALDDPVSLKSGDRSWDVTPRGVGAKIDVEGAVDAAMGVTRDSNVFVDLGRRLTLYFKGTDIALGGTVDNGSVETVMAEVAQAIDIPPVDAGLSIHDDGSITVIKARSGHVVDRDVLYARLKEHLLTLRSTELEVPMVVKQAEVQVEDDETALAQAETILGGPVTLTYEDKSWTLPPDLIATYLDYSSELVNGVRTLVPFVSAEKMGPFFTDIAATVDKAPVDATFDSDGTQAWVVPGINGLALDREATAQALTDATFRTTARTVQVVMAVVEPDLTTAEAEAMGIRDKLAGYTTEWDDGTKERRNNVRVATEYATDVVVAPGDIYSFSEQVGPRTEERGFMEAGGITGPGQLEDVFGGGICQVSTTLFNAAFFAGLEIVERRNHSLFIEHYPTGRDATVTTGIDMRFRNDTSHHILIRGISNGRVTTFNIYGTDDGREVTYETSEFYDVEPMGTVTVTNTSLAWGVEIVDVRGQDGMACDVIRTITWPNGDVKKDTFRSVWKKVDEQLIVGNGPLWAPKDTTTTTEPED